MDLVEDMVAAAVAALDLEVEEGLAVLYPMARVLPRMAIPCLHPTCMALRQCSTDEDTHSHSKASVLPKVGSLVKLLLMLGFGSS